MFDINDFDETLPGPWEWDVKRLAASFEIAGRDRGFERAERRAIVLGVRRRVPRRGCSSSRPMRNLDVWYAHIEVDRIFERAEGHGHEEAAGEGQGQRGQGQDPGQHAGVRQAHRTRSTASAGSSRTPPLIVPIEELIAAGSARGTTSTASCAT